MDLKGKFTHIFFDADDTLWENEQFFRDAEAQFAELLSDYTSPEGVQQMLWQKQEENIPLFGYGSKTYMIGMTDAAMELCGGILPEKIYYGVKKIITDLAFHEFEIIDGVVETLEALQGKYTLIVATKGDLTEQLSKYRSSGLDKYFHHCEVMILPCYELSLRAGAQCAAGLFFRYRPGKPAGHSVQGRCLHGSPQSDSGRGHG